MRAFDAHAVDYLLSLSAPTARARAGPRQVAPGSGVYLQRRQVRRARRTPAQRIVVKDGARVHVIPIDPSSIMEAQDDYVALHSRQELSETAADCQPEAILTRLFSCAFAVCL
jgi:two-component system LytT family response regulator